MWEKGAFSIKDATFVENLHGDKENLAPGSNQPSKLTAGEGLTPPSGI